MINQEEANQQIQKLGVLVLLEAPEAIQFGIDNSTWVIGRKFKGVKLIPLGTHYVHYALKDENYKYKLGFFCHFSKEHRIIVRRWNKTYEDFTVIESDEAAQYEHAVQLNDLDCYLGAYPMERYETWCRVSNYIDQQVLKQLDPIQKKTYIIEEEYEEEDNQEEEDNAESEDSDNDSDSDGMEKQQQSKQKKQKKQTKEDFNIVAGTVYYTDIPNRKLKHNLSGDALTRMNFDKSAIIEEMLRRDYGGNYKILLGEVQYAFVKFLLGEHYESFEQWKKLLILLTSCEQLIAGQPQMYIDFIPLFYNQMQQLPNDFFIDPISTNNFVNSCINNLLELTNIEQPQGLQIKLCQRSLKLQEFLKTVFISNVNGEDEDAPLLVEDLNFIQI